MNLLSSDDLSRESIEKIFTIASRLEEGKEFPFKPNSVLALYFEKPSTRTRMSFESAITKLGGNAVYIDPSTTQRSRGESLSDVARMLGLFSDFIAARLYKHSDLLEIAKSANVPVINALTDLEHPTQALADVYTILSKKKKIKGLKIAFIGDIATNTANSLVITASKLGAEVVLVGPKSVTPSQKMLTKAMTHSKVTVTDSVAEGLEGADVVYTDTFVSMGEEAEAEKRRKLFAPYQLNAAALKYAKKDATVMHCLPAHRGEEITADVLDGPQSVVVEQARNKGLLNQALLIFLSGKN